MKPNLGLNVHSASTALHVDSMNYVRDRIDVECIQAVSKLVVICQIAVGQHRLAFQTSWIKAAPDFFYILKFLSHHVIHTFHEILMLKLGCVILWIAAVENDRPDD